MVVPVFDGPSAPWEDGQFNPSRNADRVPSDIMSHRAS